MNHEYWIEGKVSIPEGKREEFNRHILKLLLLCGIRKLKNLEIGGQPITVACELEPDHRGIVRFDYSIFEGVKRQISTYNMNTCELSAPDCGYGEFSLAMNLVMAMQEAYSTENCYFMRKNEVCDVYGCALLIEHTIGLKLCFSNREKIWDMYAFFKSSGKYEDMTYETIMNKFPYGYGHMDIQQFISCWISSLGEAKKPTQPFQGAKEELKQTGTLQRAYYAYGLLQKLIPGKGKERVRDYLKNLLDLDLAGREKLASQADRFADLAEISLYDYPACIVAAYGWALGTEFWKIWDSLEITGYQDIYPTGTTSRDSQKEEKKGQEACEELERKWETREQGRGQKACEEPERKWETREQGACRKARREPQFYQVILRKNEDEFLEFWDGQELYLSDDMKRNLAEWKQEYENIGDTAAAEAGTEGYLTEILQEMQEIWLCRYADEKLVREFTTHSDELQFQKALLVFRKMLDRDLEYFPELTARQVKEWVTRRCCREEDRIKLSGYASLLANPAGRYRLFGF